MLTIERTDVRPMGPEPSGAELEAMRLQLSAHPEAPSFSIAVTVADSQEIWIRKTLDSVLAQVHDRVEVCVCDNGSRASHVAAALDDYAGHDDRITLVPLPERRRLGEAAAATVEAASGDFVAFVEPGDTITPDALFRIAELARETAAAVVYTDEQLVDEVDDRAGLVRKPYWSPELYLARPYLGRLCAIRRDMIDAVGGFAGHDAWEYDLLLRITERTSRVRHLPLPLYRRRVLSSELEEEIVDTSAPVEDRVEAATDALRRRDEDAEVKPAFGGASLSVMRRRPERPRVSAIVELGGGGRRALIVRDLMRRTAVELAQVIVVGGSPEAVAGAQHVEAMSPAAGANRAAEMATGDLLLFIEGRARLHPKVPPGWLAAMAAHAERSEVGAVGCRVVKADGSLRYGGIVVDLEALSPGSGEAVRRSQGQAPLVAMHPSNPWIVPAECLLIRADLFARMGAFNDAELPTRFYDLDLSFRLLDEGLRNVYTPNAGIVCSPVRPLNRNEIAFVWERWWERLTWLLGYQPSEANLAHPHRVERAAAASDPTLALQA